MPKAIVLPVNILVVVVVATVASLGLVGVYGVGYNPFTVTMGLESVKNGACRQLVMGSACKVNVSNIPVRYDANGNGVNDTGNNINWATGAGDDNLAVLCYKFYGRRDDASCRTLCGCPSGGVTEGGSATVDFRVSINPSSNTIIVGSEAKPTVTVSGSSTNPVVLSCGAVAGTCFFSQNNLNPTFTSILTLSGFPEGTHAITVTGTNTTTTRTASYTLRVLSAVACTSCGSWINGACNGACAATERQQTRTGSPAGCTVCPSGGGLSRCNPDATCSGACTSCSAWTNNGGCGEGGCPSTEIPQIRTGSPAGCTVCPSGGGLTRCYGDPSCYSGPCTCDWNNEYKCGGDGCTIFVYWDGWWKRCECNPTGCGSPTGTTCSGSPEYTLECTANTC